MADTNYYVPKELVIGGVDLGGWGLKVLQSSGLWNFPKMKSAGTDWVDQNGIEPSTRLIDCQYESRQITFDCIVVGNGWSDLKSKLASIEGFLHYDGCKMLICEKYSNRGYIVFLKNMIQVPVYRQFQTGNVIAELKLVFEEPQPFNVQFSIDVRGLSIDHRIITTIAIENPTSGVVTASNKQQYITVHVDDTITEVNLQRAAFSKSIDAVWNKRLMPVVITGEIDTINSLSITISEPTLYMEEAQLFLRNGTITIL